MALFVLLPLAAVFAEAFRKGVGVYVAAISNPEARSAIRLTLLMAAIAVPLNVTFGLAAVVGDHALRFSRQESAERP